MQKEETNPISQEINKLIKKAKKAAVFKRLCGQLNSILEKVKSKSIEYPENELEKLLKLFKDIGKSLKITRTRDNYMSYLALQDNIDYTDIPKSIEKAMEEVNKILKEIGISSDETYTLPYSDHKKDLSEIFDFLHSYETIAKQKSQEIAKNITEKPNSIFDVGFENQFDINDIIKKYHNYELKDNDFEKQKEYYEKNQVFKYFKGKMEKDSKNITVLKIKNSGMGILDRLFSVLSKIDHPYVETFIGFHKSDLQFLIVTNRDGIKLTKKLYEKEDNLKSGDATILAFKIAQGMEHLHSKSVIHRNLSTENIYVTYSKEDDEIEIRPNIVGFRNSRLFPYSNDLNDCSNLSIDSPIPISRFRAPEILRADRYDEKVDVFSFAGILYELLMGKIPFDDIVKSEDIVNEIINKKRPSLPDNISEELKSLINFCWDDDPNKRPSFNDICNFMISKRIIFPSDLESKDKVNKFYDKCHQFKYSKENCINTINTIKDYIAESFQFTYEFFDVRILLNSYMYELNKNIKDKKIINDPDEQNKIDKLYNDLIDLQSIVNDNTRTQFLNTLEAIEGEKNDQFKKKKLFRMNSLNNENEQLKLTDQFQNFNPSEVPKQIENIMNEIYNSMINLGYKGIEKYQRNDDKISYDLQVVAFLLIEYQKIKKTNAFEKQIDSIFKMRKELKLDENISFETLHKRLSDTFIQFHDKEINRNDFIIQSTENKNDNIKIHKGIRKSDNKLVLIKEINQVTDFISLQYEITSLLQLKNELVSDFLGFNLSGNDNSIWFVFDNYSNKSLIECIQENKLSGDDMTNIASKIAVGMKLLSSKSIIHHELNSNNIIIDDYSNIGKNPRLNRCCFDHQINVSHEMEKNITLNEKSDVFSFGKLLYEMYSKSNLLDEFSHGIKSLPFDKPIQDELRKLIESCLSYDENQRPSFEKIVDIMIKEKIYFPD